VQRTPGVIVYRPDIDGLRAISVIGVILFHAGAAGISGGFVGVDVFFVISGYLITQRLWQARASDLSAYLLDFYRARARRILPAMLAALAAVTIAAMFLFLPLDLEKTGHYLRLATIFLANVAALREDDYFNWGGHYSPLVHMWSLAVEEQFYLCFPLLMFPLARLSRRLCGLVLALLASASFLLCLRLVGPHPAAAFYFAPTRGWELLAGAVLAVGVLPPIRRRWVNEVLAAAGLVALAVALTCYRPLMEYPGWLTLLPCAAALAIIAAAREGPTVTSRCLSLRPLVYVGLISYSLYLWHVPLLSFFMYWKMGEPDAAQLSLLLALLFALATASYRWIEQPFRRGTRVRSDTRFIALAAGASALLYLCGWLFADTQGWPSRFTPSVQRFADATGRIDAAALACIRIPIAQVAAGHVCRFGATAADAPRALLWGDSHALALLPAFKQLARERSIDLYFVSGNSCRPLLGVVSVRMSVRQQQQCTSFTAAVTQAIDVLKPRTVILAGFWIYPDADFTPADPNGVDGIDGFHQALLSTLDRIAAPGRRACVVQGIPRLGFPVPYTLAMATRKGLDTASFELTPLQAHAQYAGIDDFIEGLQVQGRLTSVDPKRALCADARCRLQTDDGRSLYGDDNHLTLAGAAYVRETLAPCLD
jgi:peptidoglycan/LPS O-acetylase OafA/YrhL